MPKKTPLDRPLKQRKRSTNTNPTGSTENATLSIHTSPTSIQPCINMQTTPINTTILPSSIATAVLSLTSHSTFHNARLDDTK